MALMDWAIDVPQKLEQIDAKLFFPLLNKGFKINLLNIEEAKDELIIKKSYIIICCTDCHLKFGDMKQEFRVIVDH